MVRRRPYRRRVKLRVEPLESRLMLRSSPLLGAEHAVIAAGGSHATTPAEVAAPTEITGQVVDSRGRPVGGVPVAFGTGAAALVTKTGPRGHFVLRGVSTSGTGLLTVDGPHASSKGVYTMLMAPAAQLMTHAVVAGSVNAIPTPVVVSRIDTAHATNFRWVNPTKAIDVTSAALPGVVLHVDAGAARTSQGRPFRGNLSLTLLPATSGLNVLEVDGTGLAFRTPATLTLPNTLRYAPGTILPLTTMTAPGEIAVTGHLRVSADGLSLETIDGGILGPSDIVLPEQPPALVEAVSVGATLDTSVVVLGLTGPNVTYTIAPQPLPANMTFNRGSGELTFAPAPNQVGRYSFSVVVSDGTSSEKVPVIINVGDPLVPSTEVSGQVVDAAGRPLAGVPVMIDTLSTKTDAAGISPLLVFQPMQLP
jgi:hypothetical protein